MRNIALLEWGPASLYYLQPREKIKLRTGWLDDGPVLPLFLSSLEEAEAQTVEVTVRYALSTFEDLTSTIRNLRRCFGFPYQEYIGYLNTLTNKHRARKEHQGLIDKLRRWAMLGNVDAVVWIDYVKSNLAPGSFKMGPRVSRPFSDAHISMCAHLPVDENERFDENSEAWSVAEDENFVQPVVNDTTGERADAMVGASSGDDALATSASFKDLKARDGPLSPFALKIFTARLKRASVKAHAVEDGEESRKTPLQAKRKSKRKSKKEEKEGFRTVLQEEVIPAPGSIYPRSIVPGPGYYRSMPQSLADNDISFGYRPIGNIDSLVQRVKHLPGPGAYESKIPPIGAQVRLGRFGRAQRIVAPSDAARKLPFISAFASKTEVQGTLSPPKFYSVSPEAACATRGHVRPPQYSFGSTRRPF